MLQPSSSSVLNKKVDRQAILSLVELWLTIGKKEGNQLFTKEILFELADTYRNVNVDKQQETEDFYLLTSTEFNAFLSIERITDIAKYRVNITFDRVTIIEQLVQLGCRYRWSTNVIQYLKKTLPDKLSFGCNDDSIKFVAQAVKLLLGNEDRAWNNYSFYPNGSMDKLLHYQIEQERILDRLKVQIDQNFSLSGIIQTGLEHSRDFLQVDRLSIYQLDVPSKLIEAENSPCTVDTITYEAKHDEVVSSLNFQEESCLRKSLHCKNKYEQGFNLIVNDVEQCSDLNLCLKSLSRKFQVKSKVVIPINVRGQLWGLLIAHQCFTTRKWHYQEVQFLRQLAEYIAIAIYQNQSYHQLQQQKALLEKQVQAQAKQIRDALIAAEAASKSKHDFLGSMSHELRTPLTCVIGLSSTLLQSLSSNSKMELSPQKQQKYLELIQENGKHLLSLVNNILEFSDVESGKHLLNVEQAYLSDIAKQSLQKLSQTARAKEIVLNSEIKIEPEQEYFFCDRLRLQEILFNLLSNAIKFTPEKGEVSLRVWREKRQVVFQVEDTGIGIAPEEIPFLFEKFKQIENYRQRIHGGTGLGLALTKKLVELHGGTIEVESALGEGSLFTVYLPVKNPLQPRSTPKPAVINPALTDFKTIMLITKDEQSATFLSQLLNTIDYQVVWLMDLTMVMNQIELLQPKIIIVDRDDATGKDNIAQLVENHSLVEDVELMLLCDRMSDEQWLQFGDRRIADYLTKSMNPVQIIDKIDNLMKKNLN